MTISAEIERSLMLLVNHAWDDEIRWPEILAWAENFSGDLLDSDIEREHALLALGRFIYFGRRLVREMLRSLYRDQFEAPLIQRIRRRLRGTRDSKAIQFLFQQELAATRFIGLGNPSESGAHLLYYFRQVNKLPKELFADINRAFILDPSIGASKILRLGEPTVSKYVFFDDIVGSAQQSTSYLSEYLQRIRRQFPNLELRFMSLFATTDGLARLNEDAFFRGRASCLFELDASYKAFHPQQRYFSTSLAPDFDPAVFQAIAQHYGGRLLPQHPLGYRDGQLMIGFTYNTPDNTLPIFWNEGTLLPWSPVFMRYEKV